MNDARLPAQAVAALRRRWTPEDIERINDSLSRGEIDAVSGLMSMPDGVMRDLRGLLLTKPIVDQPLANLDLSYSLIPEGTVDVGSLGTQLTNCRFVGADLEAGNVVLSADGCDFSFCRFRTLMGTFKECIFRNANLSKVNVRNIEFIRCDFTAANMLHFHALHGVFDRCEWKATRLGRGSFASARFLGSWPTADQLGNTIMDDAVKISQI
jgi:uncharacterized protein YjbI with pentapeptide repeats